MIRWAQLSDVKEYLSERGMKSPDELRMPAFVVDEKMLVAYVEVEPKICEVHICVKKMAVRHAKRLVADGEMFLRAQGFGAMTTAIEPKYRASIKLAERVGFAPVGCYNNHIVYIKEL